ncbi:glycosyltransferase family 2 protein [Dyadobacter tibetensis]|uniref:glycosyltransferase family 2 protein n=1 Tax=Dyadobacter tibetensis TaxID=1211851 RepID=UPI000470E262|nr:glycosyltransferase family 2 protein [Dyadobacter tibetensis]
MSFLLSIVMPAYNEQDCIEKVVHSWTNFLREKFPNDNTTLIVINDGSKDNTQVLLDKLKGEVSNLTVIHQKNGGHGNAVVNGYLAALKLGSEFVFQTDSDDQFVSDDFDKLWAKRNQSDFILGYRQVRHDAGVRLFITKVLRGTISAVYGTYIMDSNIPFRLIRGTFLQKLMDQLPNPEPFAPNIFLSVMAKKSGQETFDIPITHKDRATGEVSIVKWNLWKVCIRSFQELLNFRLELNKKVKAIKA